MHALVHFSLEEHKKGWSFGLGQKGALASHGPFLCKLRGLPNPIVVHVQSLNPRPIFPACPHPPPLPCVRRYGEQQRRHSEILGRFERDMDLLAAVEIAPQARTAEFARLSDLVQEQRMREWAAQCSATHQHIQDKVERPSWPLRPPAFHPCRRC